MRCGLCVIDFDLKKIVVLRRKHKYPGIRVLKNDSKDDMFVEKYFLPRGKSLVGEESLVCAVREYIEETRSFLKKFEILEDTFILKWNDPFNVEWSYKIHFLKSSLNKNNIIDIDESDTILIEKIPINTSNCKYSKYENDEFLIMDFEEYKEKILIQNFCYFKSNYNDFLNKISSLLEKRKNNK